MALYEFKGKRPQIAKTSFVPEMAIIIGDVVIGESCFIGTGARIRGDYGSIRIGSRTSVQENVVTHAREMDRAVVGEGTLVHGEIPEGKIVVGIPAKVVGEATHRRKSEWQLYKDLYAELASVRYPKGLKRIR